MALRKIIARLLRRTFDNRQISSFIDYTATMELNEKPTYPASKIAFAIVGLAIDQKKPITPMQMQKMVYFAHGLYLAAYIKSLIEETFEGWKYGPVVPQLYHEYKIYGSEPITNSDWLFLIPESTRESDKLCPEADGVIQVMWRTLKDFDGVQLSNWTHQADSPWAKNYKGNVYGTVIPNEDIEIYFASKFLKKKDETR